MTLKEFETATKALKDSVRGKHTMCAELINGKEQCIMDANGVLGFQSSWDDNMLYVTSMGTTCASMPLAAIVRIVIH